ncbi:hypothetical protein EDD18DRAFT_1347217 [Armillaria luteobubalina]|uniref:Uncharacterized protein n=1 Tax=Armillaria luteobubalina TaxID=153913 RepID=A0AA39QGP5_9AGAR|nr:hypothetical protein EDD18DRAFT_1347217 [Armillaria luteobubalina]
MAMINDFVMEVINEKVAEIPVDVALADELEGYMMMTNTFVMEEVDIPVDVAWEDEEEGQLSTGEVNFVVETRNFEVDF